MTALQPKRLITLLLLAMLVLIQYPLWFGKGGWLRVWELERQAAAQKLRNEELRKRNAAIEADVKDLKTGTLAVEERARLELGMVRDNEVYVQIVGSQTKPASSAAAASGTAIQP